MKILYLNLDPMMKLSDLSGYATHMNELIRAFRKCGHEVYTCLGAEATPQIRSSSWIGKQTRLKRLLPSAVRITIKDVLSIRTNQCLSKVIDEAVSQNCPDIIYERSSHFMISGSDVAKKRHVPYFLEVNAPLSIERKSLSGTYLSSLVLKIQKKTCDRADKIFCVSKALKEWLVSQCIDSSKIIVVPNAVNGNTFNSANHGTPKIKRRLGLENKIIVGYLGSSLPDHGLKFLLSAVKILHSRDTNIHCLGIVSALSDKEVRERFENEEYCTLVENVPPKEIPDYVACMDVGLVPNANWYSSPIKILEYGAMGKAVIAAKTSPIEEIIIDGESGMLFQKGNLEDFVSAIHQCVRVKEKREQLGNSLRERVLSYFTWEKVAEKTLREIDKAAGVSHQKYENED